MVQIRASVAAGLLMLSFVPLYERKPVRFVITVVCAALFHVSALMILPFYFLNTKSINVKWYRRFAHRLSVLFQRSECHVAVFGHSSSLHSAQGYQLSGVDGKWCVFRFEY